MFAGVYFQSKSSTPVGNSQSEGPGGIQNKILGLGHLYFPLAIWLVGAVVSASYIGSMIIKLIGQQE